METETKCKTSIRLTPAAVGGYVWVEGILAEPDIQLTPDELQDVVQQAYDRFGILAEPSLSLEAERGEQLPDVLGMIHDHVNKAHEVQARSNRAGQRSGVQALGASVVHGVDL